MHKLKTGDYAIAVVVFAMMLFGILIFVFAAPASAANITRVFDCTGPDCSRLIAKPNDYLDMSDGTDSKPCVASNGAPLTTCLAGACAYDTTGNELNFCDSTGTWQPIGGGSSTAPYGVISTGTWYPVMWGLVTGHAWFGTSDGHTWIGTNTTPDTAEIKLLNPTVASYRVTAVGLTNSGSEVEVPVVSVLTGATLGGSGSRIPVEAAVMRVSTASPTGFYGWGLQRTNPTPVDGATAEIMNIGSVVVTFFDARFVNAWGTASNGFIAASCGSFFEDSAGVPKPMCTAGVGCNLGQWDSIQVRFCASCAYTSAATPFPTYAGQWIVTGCAEMTDVLE